MVEDFLPSLDVLIPREDRVKVTLSKRSLDYFKREARNPRVLEKKIALAETDRMEAKFENAKRHSRLSK